MSPKEFLERAAAEGEFVLRFLDFQEAIRFRAKVNQWRWRESKKQGKKVFAEYAISAYLDRSGPGVLAYKKRTKGKKDD